MNNNPMLLVCGLFCIYPLLFFALPAFLIGKSWGRVKFRSPVTSIVPGSFRNAQKANRDNIGYGRQ
jgi:hypothetical protein